MRFKTPVFVVLLGLIALPSFGAANFLGGMSGGLYTPDDVVTPHGAWEFSQHWTLNALPWGDDISATGIQYGLAKNLEVGVSFISAGDSDIALNAKYKLVSETETTPSISVGVFDAAGQINQINSDPSLYIVLSKNLTPKALKPLRVNIGAGSGIYKSFFAGLDYTIAPRTSLMFDYTGGNIGNRENISSAGIRYAVSNNVRLDAAFFDFDEFAIGASVRSTFK